MIPTTKSTLLVANRDDKGRHWLVHEEYIACTVVWQKVPLGLKQCQIKPIDAELRLSERIRQSVSQYKIPLNIFKNTIATSQINLKACLDLALPAP